MSLPFVGDPQQLDQPIALHKGTCSCTKHPLSNVVSYDNLGSSFYSFFVSLFVVSILRYYQEALLDPSWKKAMDEEMFALLGRILGSWCPCLQVLIQLFADRYLLLNTSLMVLLSATRRI